MRWEGRRQSENVEDRRGIGAPAMVGGGLFALLLMIGLMFLGVDPQQAMGISRGLAPAPQPRAQAQKQPANDAGSRFIKTILAENEDVWPATRDLRYVIARSSLKPASMATVGAVIMPPVKEGRSFSMSACRMTVLPAPVGVTRLKERCPSFANPAKRCTASHW